MARDQQDVLERLHLLVVHFPQAVVRDEEEGGAGGGGAGLEIGEFIGQSIIEFTLSPPLHPSRSIIQCII